MADNHPTLPTLRYRDGTFYMIATLVDGIGNFYVTAKNPAGPWSDPIPLPEINGIDPSFFFDDDGKAYIVHNGPPPDNKLLYDGHRAIWLFRFNTVSGKVEGRGRILVNGGVDIAKKPAWIEGPHLFHHEGFYYLIAAEGGTSVNHSEVVFRSKSIDGPFIPYEHNPILTQRDLDPNRTNPIADTGHADLVEDAAGRWWAVFLGVQPYAPDLYNTGRETFLLPVTWKDGWPIILPARQPVPGLVKVPPMPPSPHNSYNAPLVIDLLKQQLDPGSRPFEWESLRTPKSNWFHFDYTSGSISLAARPDDLTSRGNPSFIGRRQQDADFSTSVVVHLPSISVDAGLAAFQNEHTWFFLGIATTANQAPKLFIEQGTGTQAEPRKQVLASLNLPSGTTQVTLKITGQKGQISFWYQAGTAAWQPLVKDADATILSTAKAGGFVGTYLGPYARSQSAAH